MLVLSRQIDESIIIGEGDDKVEVVIVDVRGDKVRLGIIAPRKISVHHKEKAPYVTIFALGGIIIVGLKNKKEADVIYNLVIKDIKKVSKGLIKNTLK